MIYFVQSFYLPIPDVAGTHQVQLYLEGRGVGDGYQIERRMQIDGQLFKTLNLWTYTREQIADEFEVVHHVLHGRPPQGLDPREGPTRLHPGPGR